MATNNLIPTRDRPPFPIRPTIPGSHSRMKTKNDTLPYLEISTPKCSVQRLSQTNITNGFW